MPMPGYTFADEQAFRRLSWTWARAGDTKDWALLRSVCAEQVTLIYSGLTPEIPDEVKSAEAFIASRKAFLGREELHTQHFLGAVVFTLVDANHAKGEWQCRARHLLDREDGSVGEWSVGSYVNHFYERAGEDGEWKFAGVEPHSTLWQVGQWGNVFPESK